MISLPAVIGSVVTHLINGRIQRILTIADFIYTCIIGTQVVEIQFSIKVRWCCPQNCEVWYRWLCKSILRTQSLFSFILPALVPHKANDILVNKEFATINYYTCWICDAFLEAIKLIFSIIIFHAHCDFVLGGWYQTSKFILVAVDIWCV